MKLGRLQWLCEIERKTVIGHDMYGTEITEPHTFHKFWAQRIWKSEDEKAAASSIYATRVETFRAHWFDGLKPTDTLICDGARYNIIGHRMLGDRAAIEISAKHVA